MSGMGLNKQKLLWLLNEDYFCEIDFLIEKGENNRYNHLIQLLELKY